MGQVHRKIIGRALAAHLFPEKDAPQARHRRAQGGGTRRPGDSPFKLISNNHRRCSKHELFEKSSLPALCTGVFLISLAYILVVTLWGDFFVDIYFPWPRYLCSALAWPLCYLSGTLLPILLLKSKSCCPARCAPP